VEYRQKITNSNTVKKQCYIDWDNQPCDKGLVIKDRNLHKSESWYYGELWTIMSDYTNGTIRIQSGTKSERLNFRRVTPSFE